MARGSFSCPSATRSIVATLWIVLLFLVTLSRASAAWDSPRVAVAQTDFRFGKVLSGTVLAHTFTLKNEGSTPLRISRIQLTSPLVLTGMPALVAPGAEARIEVKMETSGLRGLFSGDIQIFLDGAPMPEVNLQVAGQIIPLVEVSPAPVFFLAGRRGEGRQASLEIINHESESLTIEEVSLPRDRFTTRLETLEAGRRYRLTMLLNPDGPGGRHSESIVLRTSSGSEPTITIAANTYLRERVYTFPDDVDFGVLSLRSIEKEPGLLTALTQTLMVYQFGGTDFVVSVGTDLPELAVASERGPQGDRYQNTIALVRERLKVGTFRGSIRIVTNDSEFREFSVPVSGTIVP
jgi:Protein of unknown function (DUF1573)